MKISIVVALDKNRGIGKDNKLLWHIPEDLRRFRQLTSGHTIIMGRKTFESIGRVLPNRTNIIITRDPKYKVEEAVVVYSLEEAFRVAKNVILGSPVRQNDSRIHSANSGRVDSRQARMTKKNDEDGEVFIIGGGQIFAQALPFADKLYLTFVKGDYQADTFFPDYSEFKKIVFEQEGQLGEYKYKFLDLEK